MNDLNVRRVDVGRMRRQLERTAPPYPFDYLLPPIIKQDIDRFIARYMPDLADGGQQA